MNTHEYKFALHLLKLNQNNQRTKLYISHCMLKGLNGNPIEKP